jgi:hypothetical protein
MKFLGCQIERSTHSCCVMADQVQFEIGDLQHRRLPRRPTAQDRSDARQELRERKRLDRVVIGTELQPLDAIVNGVACRQEQDRRGDLPPPQFADDAPTVTPRKQYIEIDQIV